MNIRWPKGKSDSASPCSVCESWKQEAQKHQAALDYWIEEAARLKQQLGKSAIDMPSEQHQKQLEELVGYWKQIALAKEAEVVQCHRTISQLKNDLDQQRALRAEMQKRLNEAGQAKRQAEESGGK